MELADEPKVETTRVAHESAAVVVTFLGTSGSLPTATRSGPAVMVTSADRTLLIDCGEGTARQLLLAQADSSRLDGCLFTHLHADHFLGLGGLLALLDEDGRSRPLRLSGPRGLDRIVDAFSRTHAYGFRLDVHVIDPPQVGSIGSLEFLAVSVEHPGPSLAFLIAVGGRKLVISGDTAPCSAVERLARAADLLVHESAFCDDEAERASATGHSTARQAAELANRADVKALALVHLSSRFAPAQALTEARKAFPQVVMPRDLDQARLVAAGAVFVRPSDRKGPPKSDRLVRESLAPDYVMIDLLTELLP